MPTLIRRFIRCVRWKTNRGSQKRSSPTCHIPIESAIRYGEAATSSSSGSRSLRSSGGIVLPHCSSLAATSWSAASSSDVLESSAGGDDCNRFRNPSTSGTGKIVGGLSMKKERSNVYCPKYESSSEAMPRPMRAWSAYSSRLVSFMPYYHAAQPYAAEHVAPGDAVEYETHQRPPHHPARDTGRLKAQPNQIRSQ